MNNEKISLCTVGNFYCRNIGNDQSECKYFELKPKTKKLCKYWSSQNNCTYGKAQYYECIEYMKVLKSLCPEID